MSYELDDALPPDVLAQIDPGTNVLLMGPSMSGKRRLILHILSIGASHEEGSVVVTTRDSAGELLGEYREVGGASETFLRLIDCVDTGGGPDVDADVVRSVNSPGDLTGIGIEFSEIGKDAESNDVERLRIGFDSISPLLMYVDLQRLFRFLHVFTSQIQSRNWLGIFSIDPESHETQSVNTIRQLFDGVIEIRLTDEGREVRAMGFSDTPSAWVPME